MKIESLIGCLVLETGEIYKGEWRGGTPQAGEVVFNTSHSGYEEMATDPSYFNQIMVCSAPMQGNYGAHKEVWESRDLWFKAFVCQEIQSSIRDSSWLKQLTSKNIPVLTDLDTREIVLHLRDAGTVWGAVLPYVNVQSAISSAQTLIAAKKNDDQDWPYLVSRKNTEVVKGLIASGPRVAIIDYGCKENTVRELSKICSEVAIFNSRATAREIQDWNPAGVMLSNGPGDPSLVKNSVQTVRELLSWKPIFGICMGNQILSLALGAKTYKLKFGHRGSNHPVKDLLTESIYVTSQNHGYAVDEKSLPSNVRVSQINLNDQSVEGIECFSKKCFSVQYHPESHPGPHEARKLFDYFLEQLK
jgi:carbamoyl-phosphate synthase small subunit